MWHWLHCILPFQGHGGIIWIVLSANEQLWWQLANSFPTCLLASLVKAHWLYLDVCLLCTGEEEDNALVVSGNGAKMSDHYRSNAQESDMRIWMHATRNQFSRVLIYCPDTDVFNIGAGCINHQAQSILWFKLTLIKISGRMQVDFRITTWSSPGLPSPRNKHWEKCFFNCIIVTGCDFISFFAGIGKATVFLDHSNFISERI